MSRNNLSLLARLGNALRIRNRSIFPEGRQRLYEEHSPLEGVSNKAKNTLNSEMMAIYFRPVLSAALGSVIAIMSDKEKMEAKMIAQHTLLGFVWLYVISESFASASLFGDKKREELDMIGKNSAKNILLQILQLAKENGLDVNVDVNVNEILMQKDFLKQQSQHFVDAVKKTIAIVGNNLYEKYKIELDANKALNVITQSDDAKKYSHYVKTEVDKLHSRKIMSATSTAATAAVIGGAIGAAVASSPTAGLSVLAAGATTLSVVGAALNKAAISDKEIIKTLNSALNENNQDLVKALELDEASKKKLDDLCEDLDKIKIEVSQSQNRTPSEVVANRGGSRHAWQNEESFGLDV